jgi:hypothetical protein
MRVTSFPLFLISGSHAQITFDTDIFFPFFIFYPIRSYQYLDIISHEKLYNKIPTRN